MPAWEIREAVPADAPAVAALFSEIAQESPLALLGGDILRAETVRQILARDDSPPRFALFVAQEAVPEPPAPTLVGVLLLVRGPAQADHTANIAVSVVAGHRRRGIGLALLHAADRWCLANGVVRLTASVVDANLPSLALFERDGFLREGLRPGQIRVLGADHDEILLGRRVRPDT